MSLVSLTHSDGSHQDTTLTELCAQSDYTLLFFYPKDNTSGCTLEAQGFNGLLSEFEALNTQIIGVSKDNHKSHCNFQTKHELKIPLISDTDLVLHEQFGVWIEKSMYGRKYMGTSRESFLLDRNGTIIHHRSKVKPADHPQEVIHILQTI